MEKKKIEFEPMLISFNEEAYKIQCDLASKKLEILEDARQLCLKHIDKVNLKELASDMVSYLRNEIVNNNPDMVKLNLTPNKILYLLDKQDILIELEQLQVEYEQIALDVTWIKDVPSIKVDKEPYSKWTKDEEQNTKLIAINNFIAATKDLDKHTRILKGLIPQLTNQNIQIDFRKQLLKVNSSIF